MSDIFEKMLDPERIGRFLEYRKSRMTEEFRIARMEAYLTSPEYETDVRRLMEGDYYFSIPVKKMIPKGYTNRKRTVYHFEENEMTLLRMMSFVLHEYEDLIPQEVYSFKKGISAKDFILMVHSDKRLHHMYVAKTDIRDYGNSINPDRLIPLLQQTLGAREPKAVAFFIWLLSRKTFFLNGKLENGDTAALPGIPIHNFFTNLYLTPADRILIPRCEAYARYSDDIIMFCATREEAVSNLDSLLSMAKDLGLTPHSDPAKTKIFEPGETYEYLGIAFSGSDIDIARSS